MGQKVNPIAFRLGVNRSWNSNWHSFSNFTELLHEDLQITKYLEVVYEKAGFLVGGCKIERSSQKIHLLLTISEPMKKRNTSVNVDQVQKTLEKITKASVSLSIHEVPTASNAMLLAKDIARQLEERSPFGMVLKRAMQSVMESKTRKVLGVKIQCSGRLNGEDIARTEWVKEGQVPLHTFDAHFDYAASRAYTIYGVCGVKVWICFDPEKK